MCLSRKNMLEVTSPAIVGLKAFLDSLITMLPSLIARRWVGRQTL